jgi:hypothetical protein
MSKTFNQIVQELEIGSTKLIPVSNAKADIASEIKNGIILNLALWSGPAFLNFKRFYSIIEQSKYKNIYVLDHDSSDDFQNLFDTPNQRLFGGTCEIFLISKSQIIYKSIIHTEDTFTDLKQKIKNQD